jgi:hypothetical protein
MLSRLFRRLFLEALADAHTAGRLAFFGEPSLTKKFIATTCGNPSLSIVARAALRCARKKSACSSGVKRIWRRRFIDIPFGAGGAWSLTQMNWPFATGYRRPREIGGPG